MTKSVQRITRLCVGLVGGVAAAAVLILLSAGSPPPLEALHNISVPMDAQIARSVLAQPRQADERRVVFLSNCFFHGAIQNGARITVVPDSLSLVGRFRRDHGEGLTVFNASVDGTSILDHLALLAILRDLDLDAVVVAMSYTEFRRLPLHALLGNLRDQLLELGVDEADLGDAANSRGRVISMDFQRWLTARKYDLYNALPFVLNLQLWNLHLREHTKPWRDAEHYARIYGGEAIPVRHVGLSSPVDQDFRGYLQTFVDVAAASGIDVVLVNQPIRFRAEIEEANPGLFATHRGLLAETARRHDNVEFIDLDAQVPRDEILSDYIHLTYDGLVRVAAVLGPQLAPTLRGADSP